jgi:hypothetical protein
LLAGALQHQVCDQQRLLGKKTLENVILHEVLYLASRKRLDDTLRRRFPIRSQWHARTWQHKQPLHHAGGRGRRLQPNAEQLAEITKIIAGLPTCSYRRAHALIL